MNVWRFFQKIQPYLTAIVVMAIATLLVEAIYYTGIDPRWITFLTGILVASLIGMLTYASRTLWLFSQRASQLTSLKDQLEQESNLRKALEADYQKTLQTIQQTEFAISRLIPSQLLKLLDRDSILDVQLGDQVERKLTILFSDIRNFTALSETMTPQENFNFLNSYLKQMAPIINTHRGIIDKYIGDSIMALFPHGSDDALAAAIHMLEKLDEYNAGRARAGYVPIQIGIGLNTGLVMIGTVGGAIRMESTVIGDAVNLTSRIEEATKTYQTPLLITQNTYYDLASPERYNIRFLDRIRVKGKIQPLSIYEVFDADSAGTRSSKRATQTKFEQAVAHYHLKNIPHSKKLFEESIEAAPKDIPARIYLSRCERSLSSGQHSVTGELNTPLAWSREFQIGIKEVDISHVQLFKVFNEFITASSTGDSTAIRNIIAHLDSHFKGNEYDEENLMRQYHYPFLFSHLQEHKRFMELFSTIRKESESENTDLASISFRAQLLMFDWFTGHITKSDRHAGRFLLSQIQPPPIPPKPFQ